MLGVLVTACHSAPARTPEPVKPIGIECVAAPWWFAVLPGSSGYRLWPEAGWQAGQDTVPRSPDSVAERLKGNYRLLVATSEGAGAKWIAEWSLTLEPTPPARDSAWRNLWIDAQRRVYFPLIGRMEYRRGGYLTADGSLTPARNGWTPAPDSVRLWYEPAAVIMRLEGAPFDALDAGTPYAIYAVDSAGGFSGRWTTGGFGISLIRTPFGNIGEQSGGYFCAQRDSSR
jgi:hypothetical protein